MISEFDVLALGNAIVDVIARAEEDFLVALGVAKGSMTLIDEAQAEKLYAAMGPATIISGGSAANTVVGAASFGGKCAFVGRVKADPVGDIFAHDIVKSGVAFGTSAAIDGPYATYPMVEPIVLEHPWKLESTFRLVQGVRKFKAEDVVDQLPEASVHLMVAEWDQYIAPKILEDLWKQIPKRARQSRLIINHSEHKIAEAMPSFSAKWVRLIVEGDERLKDGRTCEGGSFLGYAASGTERIKVN